jgi:hypothetical protein
VRRGLAWAAGVAGILAALLVRRRRDGAASVPAPGPDPAEELRHKLAAARVPEPAPKPPPAAPEPSEPPADAAARRRDVHAEARAAIDEMRGAPGEESPE